MESDLLSDREKAAVLWAEHVTKNTARSRDDIYEAVRAQFSEAEMVELTMMSGMFNFYNRFMDSLGVPLELQDDIDKIKRSVDLDPSRVKAYLQTLIDNWPDEFPTPNKD
ncbi:MAG: carboxymuconolactone decarboxylase family protein [Rhodospirillales bacterium]|jgi:hypothetical protein